MRKRFLALLLLAALLIGLNGCSFVLDPFIDLLVVSDKISTERANARGYGRFLDEGTSFSEALDALGVDRSTVTVQYGMDDHGGFLGDGTMFIIAALPVLPERIKTSENWRPLPLTEPLAEYLKHYLSPHLTDKNGSPLLPDVEHGYYCFVDRNTESTDPKDAADLLHRYSFNVTIMIYDTDTNLLYFIKDDT